MVVLIGLTWAFFQHLLSGIRHLVTDTGENFELGGNKNSAIATFVVSVLLTAAAMVLHLGRREMSLGDSSTELGKVRGLGSAREGGEHWIGETGEQRRAASSRRLADRLAAVPPGARLCDGERVAAQPLGAVPMALFVITAFYHGLDGLKVVVDDYVHEPGNNFALNTLLLFLAVGGAGFALFALAKIAFGAAA